MRDFYTHILVMGGGTEKQDNIMKGKVQAYTEIAGLAEFIGHYKKTN